MFKKGIVYILLCSLLNLVTTLPGKCCVRNTTAHAVGDKAHSLTLFEIIFQDVLGGGDETGSNNGSDFHVSVFNVDRKSTTGETTKYFQAKCKPASVSPAVASLNYTGYNTRQFPLPPHYNYLFRLTPF